MENLIVSELTMGAIQRALNKAIGENFDKPQIVRELIKFKDDVAHNNLQINIDSNVLNICSIKYRGKILPFKYKDLEEFLETKYREQYEIK